MTTSIVRGAAPLAASCCTAAARWSASPGVVPGGSMAPMRSIHTAVGWRPTTRIWAPSVPPAALAAVLTCACQAPLT